MDVFVNENEENIKPNKTNMLLFFHKFKFLKKTFLNCSLANTSLMRSITSLVPFTNLSVTDISYRCHLPYEGRLSGLNLMAQLHLRYMQLHCLSASLALLCNFTVFLLHLHFCATSLPFCFTALHTARSAGTAAFSRKIKTSETD